GLEIGLVTAAETAVGVTPAHLLLTDRSQRAQGQIGIAPRQRSAAQLVANTLIQPGFVRAQPRTRSAPIGTAVVGCVGAAGIRRRGGGDPTAAVVVVTHRRTGDPAAPRVVVARLRLGDPCAVGVPVTGGSASEPAAVAVVVAGNGTGDPAAMAV